MAIFQPSLRTIGRMKPAPTPGEQQLLEFLQKLDNSYIVYFQPHLNGLKPDVVIVRKNGGVLIIEVKDYHLPAYRAVSDKVWAVYQHGEEQGEIVSPFCQAEKYKLALYDFMVPELVTETILENKKYAIVQTGVFFSQETRHDVQAFLAAYKAEPAHSVYWGYDNLTSLNSFFSVQNNRNLQYLYRRCSRQFTDNLYKAIQQVLQPDDRMKALERQQPVLYDPSQQAILHSRRQEMKVCGVAGTGKTQVLAQLAVNEYKRTQSPVLIVTFNITLRHYLEDTISMLRGDISRDAFVIIHYHGLYYYYEPTPYKTVLIDEVQDFEDLWIQHIRKYFLAPEGRLILFGDVNQNIYNRKLENTGAMKYPNTGIRGRWLQLRKNYRANTAIRALSMKFRKTFLGKKYPDDQEKWDLGNLFDFSSIEHDLVTVQTKEELAEYLYLRYRGLTRGAAPKITCSLNDICFLCSTVAPLRYLASEYFSSTATTTFESEEFYQKVQEILQNKKKEEDARLARQGLSAAQRREADQKLEREYRRELNEKLTKARRPCKFGFRSESGKVKMSTIHSYKGWETNTVFLVIDNTQKYESADAEGQDEQEGKDPVLLDELVYTAITRARQHLIIIENGTGPFTDFFRRTVPKPRSPGF